MTREVLKDIKDRLQDIEYRRAFGSATAKYELAKALVEGRHSAGMTQEALARTAGVSQAYIAKLESSQANPTIGTIGALLAVMWLRAKMDNAPILDGCGEMKK